MANVQAADGKEAVLLSRWESVKARHDEVVRQLQDESVLSQPDQIRKLNKERVEIEELAQLFDVRQSLLRQQSDAVQLLNDPSADAEFHTLAEQEDEQLRVQLKALEQRAFELLVPKDRAMRKTSFWRFGRGRAGKRRVCSPGTSSGCTNALPSVRGCGPSWLMRPRRASAAIRR